MALLKKGHFKNVPSLKNMTLPKNVTHKKITPPKKRQKNDPA